MDGVTNYVSVVSIKWSVFVHSFKPMKQHRDKQWSVLRLGFPHLSFWGRQSKRGGGVAGCRHKLCFHVGVVGLVLHPVWCAGEVYALGKTPSPFWCLGTVSVFLPSGIHHPSCSYVGQVSYPFWCRWASVLRFQPRVVSTLLSD